MKSLLFHWNIGSVKPFMKRTVCWIFVFNLGKKKQFCNSAVILKTEKTNTTNCWLWWSICSMPIFLSKKLGLYCIPFNKSTNYFNCFNLLQKISATSSSHYTDPPSKLRGWKRKMLSSYWLWKLTLFWVSFWVCFLPSLPVYNQSNNLHRLVPRSQS